jgi:hypothetical protein
MSSSAGCPISTAVPDQTSVVCASTLAIPSIQVTWASWPHTWATGDSLPSSRRTRTVLAYSRPVASSTDKASMSARYMTVRPAPLRRIATTPVPAIPVVTAKPNSVSARATIPEVRVSANPSSGWR